ncbi:AfsR/SARP family transcriptional regulator [Actinokineospora iranica]|uniref:AfsR/SARP family transcriptional regulator n=1 Tax=Actinokineospora iranica TaxID=1271860 RepID=UPI001E533DE0|nr:AfsR/SARP family transcriptional regulator [Actinokineospora iranica]
MKKSKTGQVLALLLARNNETVGVDTLIEELWGDRVPRSALTTLQTYVYHARKMFARSLHVPCAESLLVTRPPGYLISVPDDAVDANVFECLVKQGIAGLSAGNAELAADRLTEALTLWQGPPFAGMPVGDVLDAHVTYLHELRLSAITHHVEANKRLGRYQVLVPELRSLVAANPLNEGFHSQLIEVLHKCGRRAEALQAYQRLWRVLDAELGVAPAPEVQRLHHEVLAHGRSVRTPNPV